MTIHRQHTRVWMWVFISILVLCPSRFAAGAGDSITVTELSPTLLVFATASGNIVASVGPDGALMVGTPAAANTSEIERILAHRTDSPARYVVIAPESAVQSEGDAGWGKRGAFVAMHERALQRLGGNVMGKPPSLPPRFVSLGVDRPRIAFSDVLAFDLNGESIHIVHQPPGYSDADAIAHFHLANVVYLGEVFSGDGYPMVDAVQGGNFDGVIATLEGWTGEGFRIVPARGPVAKGTELKEFHDMPVTTRDRIKEALAKGQSESEIIRSRPTADFDSKWGHGRVAPDDYVREVLNALKHQSTK